MDNRDDKVRDINAGLSRLTRFDLIRCYGNVLSFVKQTDIPNIQSFSYESEDQSSLFERARILSRVSLRNVLLSPVFVWRQNSTPLHHS
jgi:hypothetical protein